MGDMGVRRICLDCPIEPNSIYRHIKEVFNDCCVFVIRCVDSGILWANYSLPWTTRYSHFQNDRYINGLRRGGAVRCMPLADALKGSSTRLVRGCTNQSRFPECTYRFANSCNSNAIEKQDNKGSAGKQSNDDIGSVMLPLKAIDPLLRGENLFSPYNSLRQAEVISFILFSPSLPINLPSLVKLVYRIQCIPSLVSISPESRSPTA